MLGSLNARGGIQNEGYVFAIRCGELTEGGQPDIPPLPFVIPTPKFILLSVREPAPQRYTEQRDDCGD